MLFNAERWEPYNRVKLTPLLAGDVQIGQVFQQPNFPAGAKVDLHTGRSIVKIDRRKHTVTCPLHNWVLDLKTGEAVGPDEGKAQTIPVKIEEGQVFIRANGASAARIVADADNTNNQAEENV